MAIVILKAGWPRKKGKVAEGADSKLEIEFKNVEKANLVLEI
jgi:hypothetical protein